MLNAFHTGKVSEKYERIATQLLPYIDKKKTIVYVDFVQDAAPIAIALRQQGMSSSSYHGQKMSSNDKTKTLQPSPTLSPVIHTSSCQMFSSVKGIPVESERC